MIPHWLIDVLFIVLGGVAWRLRGGAFTAITGINPGTDGARAIGAVMIGVPLAALSRDWRVLTLVPAIFAGLAATGWGPFQGMGEEGRPGYKPEKSWMRWLPQHVGLRAGHIGEDYLGLLQAGFLCTLPAALVSAWWGTPLAPVMLAASGAMFPAAYVVALIDLPVIPRFAREQSWGEVGAGMLLMAAGLGAAGCM